jgi:lysophospholipase L1-like esterase
VTSLRICFIGDSIVNGTGDATMLGWTGRVCAAAADAGHDITHYDLGVRGDTSTLIRERWRVEATRRLPDAFKAMLVFSFGINDCVHLDGVRRVAPDASLSNARAILGEARKWRPTLFIGPTPIDARERVAQFYPGVRLGLDGRDIAALNRGLLQAAASVEVPALDLFTPLDASADWAAAIARDDGVHPPAGGYALMAKTIAAWSDWQALLADAP